MLWLNGTPKNCPKKKIGNDLWGIEWSDLIYLSDSLASCFIFHVFVSNCRLFCVIGGQHSLMGVANQNTLDWFIGQPDYGHVIGKLLRPYCRPIGSTNPNDHSLSSKTAHVKKLEIIV